MPELDVCPVEELPSCSVKIVYAGSLAIGVYNLNGEYYALEDRCSHDDGPLCEGVFDVEEGVVVCPRHGATFDIDTTSAALRPSTISVSIDVAAWLIAQPRPENFTSSIVSPSSPNAT